MSDVKNKYNTWIDGRFPDKEKSEGMCDIAVNAMLRDFCGDLQPQYGLANDIIHSWLIDRGGSIIDPTFRQFDKPIKYELLSSDYDEFRIAVYIIGKSLGLELDPRIYNV